jgi:hypothetical protein
VYGCPTVTTALGVIDALGVPDMSADEPGRRPH